MNSISKLAKLLYPINKNLRQIYFLALLQSVFYLAVPLSIQFIVTYIMVGSISISLVLLCLLTITVIVFVGLFQLWQMRINESVQQSILVDVAVKFSHKISMLKPELYLADYLPRKINHFFDVLTLQKGLTKILLDFSFSIISILFGVIILSFYSSAFLVFALLTAVVFFLLIRRNGGKALDTFLNESKQKYLFVDWLQNLYQLVKNPSESLTNDFIVRNTDDYLSKYIEEKNRLFKILDYQYRGIFLFKVLFISFVLFTGIWLVQMGEITIGQFVTSEIIVLLILNSVEKVVINLRTVYEVLTATEKLHQTFELEEDVNKKDSDDFINLKSAVDNKIYAHSYSKKIRTMLYVFVTIGFISLLLPWNQTIECKGNVSSLNPSDRPQEIPSRISGRIEKWFVNEGMQVKKNDTIAFISEIKEDYLDPQLIERTQEQLNAKESSVKSYESKVDALDSQIDALNNILLLKIKQLKNKLLQAEVKVLSDSVDFVAISNNYKIAELQFKRYEELLAKGIISKTDFENRKVKVQEGYAKKVQSEYKWNNSRNELLNVEIELTSIKQEYNEKLMKAESEKFSVMSALYDTEAGLTKIQNQLTNYNMRNAFYFVTAPQDGYIVKSFVNGVGSIVKDGAPLVSLVPVSNNLSVELYIDPVELPLVYKDMNVQIQFDGWPAFVFSGWPGASIGSYQAKVVSIDKVISENGKFRILATKGKQDWPFAIQIGSGVKGFALLKPVPLVYELWRKANGFPPEFYSNKTNTNAVDKKGK